MINITKQVFSEVYDVIYNMDIYKYIPKSFIEFIDSNRDTEYKVNIDYTKSLNEQELQKGTKVLLSLIYRDYLCSEEERKILIQKDKEELKRIEEETREKYKIEKVFKNKKEINSEVECKEKCLIVFQKEKWYKKIFDIIKRFMERNKKNS